MEHSDPRHEKRVAPDPAVISEAYGDIARHNRENTGFGALFGNTIKQALKNEGVKVQASDDLVIEGDMSAALQDILHNDTFARIGIKVGPFGNSVINLASGGAATSKELTPTIENQSIYTEFLGALTPSDAQDENINRLLGDVVGSLNQIVDFAFADESIAAMSHDERRRIAEVGEDALRTFVAIEDEYVRLGVDANGLMSQAEGLSGTESRDKKRQAKVYASLSRRVTYWGRNILTEGIIADKKEYLVPPAEQGFGPANWHKDGGQRYWAAALGFLSQIQDGERTREFSSEVREGLLRSLDAAIEEINHSTEELYYSDQAADLENVRAAIAGEEFDAQKLLAYTEPPDYLR